MDLWRRRMRGSKRRGGSRGRSLLWSMRPRRVGLRILVGVQSLSLASRALQPQIGDGVEGRAEVLKFSTNSIRGFFPGVPSNIALVLLISPSKHNTLEDKIYLASSTKLLALLGVGEPVLGVNVEVISSPSGCNSHNKCCDEVNRDYAVVDCCLFCFEGEACAEDGWEY